MAKVAVRVLWHAQHDLAMPRLCLIAAWGAPGLSGEAMKQLDTRRLEY